MPAVHRHIIALGLLAVAVAPLGAQGRDSARAGVQPEWRLGGTVARAYRLEDALPVTEATRAGGGGSGFVLRHVPGGEAMPAESFVSATTTLPATGLRGRRLRVEAELQGQAAVNGSLWVRVDGRDSVLAFENGGGAHAVGTTAWRRQQLVIDVAPAAERVMLGAVISGGTLAVRALRVETVELTAADTLAHPDAVALLDSAIALARRHALVRDTVSWDVVIPEMRGRLRGAKSRNDAYPVVAYFARRLGDKHSFFMPPMQMQAMAARAEERIEARDLANGRVGYVRVPAHGGRVPDTSKAIVREAREAIAARAPRTCGWVVDLRGNGGGNMWPMLAALRPLLGDGDLGGFRSLTTTAPWSVRRATAYDSTLAPPPDLAALPVAVLTDGRTASSGEAVATAFRGRPRTRTFGAPTRGLSTANSSYRMPGDGWLMLTTAVYVDRAGTTYGGPMVPDEAVAEAAGSDAPLARALAWLASEQGCVATR